MTEEEILRSGISEALTAAHALADEGIAFVPIPVGNIEEAKRLADTALERYIILTQKTKTAEDMIAELMKKI